MRVRLHLWSLQTLQKSPQWNPKLWQPIWRQCSACCETILIEKVRVLCLQEKIKEKADSKHNRKEVQHFLRNRSTVGGKVIGWGGQWSGEKDSDQVRRTVIRWGGQWSGEEDNSRLSKMSAQVKAKIDADIRSADIGSTDIGSADIGSAVNVSMETAHW